jgi:hypothetical protein
MGNGFAIFEFTDVFAAADEGHRASSVVFAIHESTNVFVSIG